MQIPNISSGIRHIADTILQFALPPRCAGCGDIVAEDYQFCADCWKAQHFLGPPWCATCHVPLPEAFMATDDIDVRQCAGCMAKSPRHDGLDAVMAYGDVASRIAIQLKHGRRIGNARMMARFMTPIVARIVGDTGKSWVLVPVPLHRWRIWARGFNQSAMVANAIVNMAMQSGINICHVPDALLREQRTPLLRGKNPQQRRKMLKGAITIHAEQVHKIRGANIILIDDVYTTGATTETCVTALKKAGAAHVRILCWARVLPFGMENSGI